MACGPIVGIPKNCAKNAGGMKTYTYFWLQDNLLGYNENPTLGTITAVEFNDGTAPVLPVVFKFSKNVSNLGENLVTDPTSDNSTNTVTLTIQVNRREYSKHAAINTMASGARELVAIAPDKNGQYWFCTNLVLTTVDSTTGAAPTDANMYTLTFVGELDQLVYGIEEANIDTLVSTGKFGTLS